MLIRQIECGDVIKLTVIWSLETHIECCVRNDFCCVYMVGSNMFIFRRCGVASVTVVGDRCKCFSVVEWVAEEC